MAPFILLFGDFSPFIIPTSKLYASPTIGNLGYNYKFINFACLKWIYYLFYTVHWPLLLYRYYQNKLLRNLNIAELETLFLIP